ncbi:MAG: cation:proton antiporter [Deltaproteobacteria bacterium]|nr:cation:proton antiporter [Deltaproteobacteria bacterium]
MDSPILNDILVIILLSVVVIYICHQMRLPIIVGFLLTGLLAGPHGFALVHEIDSVKTLAETGIILLMFTIGLEFSFRSLFRIRKPVLLGGSVQIVLTILITFAVARIAGFDTGEAVFAGFLVSLSSTAIVMKVFQDRAEMDTPQGNASLGILIFQDLAVVPMMLLIPLVAGTQQTEWHIIAVLAGKIVGIVLLVPFLSRWLIPRLFFGIAKTRSRELFLITTLAICLAVAWLTQMAGLSLALGSFLAGLIISDSEYSHQALGEILPFKDVFTSFFFVSVGMLLDIGYFWQHPLLLLLTAVGVLLVKSLTGGIAAFASGLSLRPAMIAGIAICQVGEFSFILAETGISEGLVSTYDYQTFLSVSVLTMMASPFLIAAAPAVAERANRLPLPKRLKKEKAVTASGKVIPRENHIIIVGFGLNGKNLARAAGNAGIPYAIIEMNPASVRTERAKGEPITFGDATKAAVLIHAGIRQARTLVIVINDPIATRRITELARRLNPRIYILVRTRYVSEMGALIELGASDVIPEEFETSVEIFSRVLAKYFIPKEEIEKMTGEIRSEGYDMFRSFSRSGLPVCTVESCLPDLEIASFRLGEGSSAVGRTLQETEMRKRHGVTLLAVNRKSEIISNPPADLTFAAGDILFVVGDAQDIRKVRDLFGPGESILTPRPTAP